MRSNLVVVLVTLAACGTGASSQGGNSGPPPAPALGGTSSGAPAGDAGSAGGVFVGGAAVPPASGSGTGSGGGTSAPQGGSGSQASGGQTLWSHKMGGLGVEYTHDVAVTPDGNVVAFNLIGVRGESLEQIGFVHMDASGNEFESEFENERGAALHLAPSGSFVVAPSGGFLVAGSARCAAGACPTLGGKPVDGGAVASLSPRAQPVWQVATGGDVTSNVDVDAQGRALVGAQADGGVVRVYRADGTLAWQHAGLGTTGPFAVAFDGAGGALAAVGGSVVRLDGGGSQTWQRVLGSDVAVTALRPVPAGGSIVHGWYRGTLPVAGTTLQQPSGSDHGWFLAQLASDGTPRWAVDLGVVQETADGGPAKTLLAVRPDGAIVLVTGADACTAAVATFESTGAPRWRRPVAVNGCGGTDLVVHGLAITPANRIVLGGAMSARIDFGTGPLDALATDAFVVELAP